MLPYGPLHRSAQPESGRLMCSLIEQGLWSVRDPWTPKASLGLVKKVLSSLNKSSWKRTPKIKAKLLNKKGAAGHVTINVRVFLMLQLSGIIGKDAVDSIANFGLGNDHGN
ncbi:hypothetical protein U9M48_018926 [Paspalum notatum var. saurae]|uniref:Uncharacterized protein n=1 Tax=Paspalum notatum var. saurae TaxID=547442 RepID=A0AAQ3TC49_PASNO